MKNNIVSTILIAVIVGAATFYGGTVYGQNSKSLQANTLQQGGRQFGAGGQGGRPGIAGNLANGEIMSKDDKSITIKLRNGGSQFIFFSPTTQILKSTAGTADDLLNGANITATGTANSDGSVTAQMIQIRPPLLGDGTSPLLRPTGMEPFGNRGGAPTQQSGSSSQQQAAT